MRKSWGVDKVSSWSNLKRVLIYARYRTELYKTTVTTTLLVLFAVVIILVTKSFSQSPSKCQSLTKNPTEICSNFEPPEINNDHKQEELKYDIQITSKNSLSNKFQTGHSSRQGTPLKDWLEKAETIYQRSVQKRHHHVQSIGGLSKVNPWPENGDGVVYFWDFFVPSFTCPYMIERVGAIGDGGKWVCGLEIFEGSRPQVEKCVIYSFGVANESSFEAEILGRTSCEIHAFDFSVDNLGHQIKDEQIERGKIHFNKIGLNDKDKNETFLTLGTLMRQRRHDWIDILKIDIEGSEFPCLQQVMEEFSESLPFGQLLIELHVDNFGRGFKSMYKWWEKLEARGLRAFMNEVNHHSCVGLKINPVAVEYSFINVKTDHRLIAESSS